MPENPLSSSRAEQAAPASAEPPLTVPAALTEDLEPIGSPATDALKPPPSPGGAAVAPSLPPGYEALGELGEGGMGVVYKVRQVSLNRVCALKMIRSGESAGRGELERFRGEARALAALQHPHIVQVFEVGEFNGHPFFSLEYCSGGSLDRQLNGTPIDPRQAARLVQTLAAAVHAAHQANVIHRDLKPGNVLLTADGTPKVTDFGLAKKLDDAGQTQTGAVMGTPSYMPPEQAQGRKEVGPLADVYALGAVLYECLTGRPPFRGATKYDTLIQVVSDEPVPPRQLNPKVPIDLETICLKCLHKEPGRRYESAAALAADLGRFLGGEPIQARPVGRAERLVKWARRHRAVSALAATAAVLLLAGVGASWVLTGWALTEAESARQAEERAGKRAEKEAKATKRAEEEKARAEKQRDRAERMVYASKLMLAQSAYQAGNSLMALQHLDECQWHLRGWEHRYLWTLFNSKQVFRGHTGRVTSVAWSPDGNRLFTGSAGGTAKVWDAATAQLLVTFQGHTGPVTRAMWSPDGHRLLTFDGVNLSGDGWIKRKGVAKVWDAATGRLVITLKGISGGLASACWKPDGRCILTSEGNVAKVWDASTGQELRTLSGHNQEVIDAVWSPDGSRLLTGSMDHTARVWDAATGYQLLLIQLQKGYIGSGSRLVRRRYDGVKNVRWSPDGDRLLTVDLVADNMRLWNAATGTEYPQSSAFDSSGFGLAWSPDGRRIVTCNRMRREVEIWSVQTGRKLGTLVEYEGGMTDVAWSPDGQYILTTGQLEKGQERSADVWDALTGRAVVSFPNATAPVAWSPDGRRILTGSGDNTARVWNLLEEQVAITNKPPAFTVYQEATSADGRRLSVLSGDNAAKVIDIRTTQELIVLKGHTAEITSAVWSPDGRRILTSSEDRTVKIWDPDSGSELLTLVGHKRGVFSVAWSRDGRKVVSQSRDRQSVTIDRRFAEFSGGGETGQNIVWEAVGGPDVFPLKGHTRQVKSVAFSPDGKLLFAWDEQHKVLAWSTVTGQPVDPIDPPPLPAPGPARSPDGFLRAEPRGNVIEVIDTRRVDPEANHWPLPDAAERKRYHAEQAALTGKRKQWFAAAFHLRRLLADQPDDAVRKRLAFAEAQRKAEADNRPPARMEHAK